MPGATDRGGLQRMRHDTGRHQEGQDLQIDRGFVRIREGQVHYRRADEAAGGTPAHPAG